MSGTPPDHAAGDASGERSAVDLRPLDEVSRQLHVSVGTLYQWRHHRKNLRFYKIGGRVMCDQADIDAYIAHAASEPAA